MSAVEWSAVNKKQLGDSKVPCRAVPGLSGFAVAVHSVPDLADPGASGVHYLNASAASRRKDDETRAEEKMEEEIEDGGDENRRVRRRMG